MSSVIRQTLLSALEPIYGGNMSLERRKRTAALLRSNGLFSAAYQSGGALTRLNSAVALPRTRKGIFFPLAIGAR